MQQRVAIIIPTYNRKKTTERCVNSLINGTYKNIKIILCDSDSIDGTGSIFENRNIHCSINVGSDSWWTAAINQGVTIAKDELRLLSFLVEMLKPRYRNKIFLSDELNDILQACH